MEAVPAENAGGKSLPKSDKMKQRLAAHPAARSHFGIGGMFMRFIDLAGEVSHAGGLLFRVQGCPVRAPAQVEHIANGDRVALVGVPTSNGVIRALVVRNDSTGTVCTERPPLWLMMLGIYFLVPGLGCAGFAMLPATDHLYRGNVEGFMFGVFMAMPGVGFTVVALAFYMEYRKRQNNIRRAVEALQQIPALSPHGERP